MIARRLLVASFGLVSACGSSTPDGPCPQWTVEQEPGCTLRAWVRSDVPLSAPGASDVQVALGPAGAAVVAWTQASQSETTIELVEHGGDGRWARSEFPVEEGAAVEPAVALGPDGEAVLAWKQQSVEGSVHLATRDPTGPWMRIPEPISWPGNAYEPRVEIGNDGEALLVWNQWAGQVFGVAVGRRAPDAPSFAFPREPAELLSPPTNYSNAPRLALSPTGEALIAWYQAPVDDLMVFASERRAPGDSFSQPSDDGFISPPGGPVESHAEANPQPALHPSGAAAIVWTQQRGEGSTPVYLATRNADGQWTSPVDLDDSISALDVVARCPEVVFTPDGVAVVLWHQTRGGQSNVFVWRADEPDARRLSTEGVEAAAAVLGVAADGGLLAVWSERVSAEVDAAWVVTARRHQDISGQWRPPETLSTASPGRAPVPRLTTAGDGHVLVAWAQGSVVEGEVFTATVE